MGGRLEFGDTTIYFGDKKRLVEAKGFGGLPLRVKSALEQFAPVGTARGFSIYSWGDVAKAGRDRVEIRPEGIIFQIPKDRAGHVQLNAPVQHFPIPGGADLIPMLEMDLPEEHRRDRGERFNDELE